MGGDGHHVETPKVPDYKIYTVDKSVPQLIKLQNRLAEKGLKDPWIRNEVWRFRVEWWGKPLKNYFNFIFRGFWMGAAATAIVLGTTKLLSKDDEHGHGHGHDGSSNEGDKGTHH